MMSSVTGNLCIKCPKHLVKQKSSYSDYFNVISGFKSNSRTPGGPVTVATSLKLWHCNENKHSFVLDVTELLKTCSCNLLDTDKSIDRLNSNDTNGVVAFLLL